ncbi:hypothetical protein [Devosia sp. A449]
MERIIDWLAAMGYPEDKLGWLQRRRLPLIIVLALLSWALVAGLIWLVFGLLF